SREGAPVTTREEPRRGAMFRMLDAIERVGNRIPHPFWIFLILGGVVLVLSLVLSWFGVGVESPAEEEPVEVVNLLSVAGIRRIVTEAITNFTGFPPLGIVLVVMMGVAVAEGSGMIAGFVRGVVTMVSGRWLTFAVALTGITGSVASDAVIIVLPPLAAMAYLAVGRSEEHTSELQSRFDLVCRLLLEKKKKQKHLVLVSMRPLQR